MRRDRGKEFLGNACAEEREMGEKNLPEQKIYNNWLKNVLAGTTTGFVRKKQSAST